MSSSSRPKLPLSPLCGFSPQTPMRGRARPLRRSASSIRRIASPTRSWLSRPGTSARATWEVTREVQRSSRTLNSQNGPPNPRRSANQCNSSLWSMPAMCSEVLFSGPKRIASVLPLRVSSRASARVSRL